MGLLLFVCLLTVVLFDRRYQMTKLLFVFVFFFGLNCSFFLLLFELTTSAYFFFSCFEEVEIYVTQSALKLAISQLTGI